MNDTARNLLGAHSRFSKFLSSRTGNGKRIGRLYGLQQKMNGYLLGRSLSDHVHRVQLINQGLPSMETDNLSSATYDFAGMDSEAATQVTEVATCATESIEPLPGVCYK